jgi:hypothetical protein
MHAHEVLTTHAQEVPEMEALEAVVDDTRLGANSVEADGTKPQPDDTTWGPSLDLMVHGCGSNMPRRTAPRHNHIILRPGCLSSEEVMYLIEIFEGKLRAKIM